MMIEHINITLIERLQAASVVRNMARENGLSVLQTRLIIQQDIDSAWKRAWTPGNLRAQVRWQLLFPADRRPTVDEFIVTIAREMTAGRTPPYLLD